MTINPGSSIALITGASSGIGAATAVALAEHGYRLILCGRNRNRLEQVCENLPAATAVMTLLFDVRKEQEVRQAISSLPAAWASVDVLINNAGNAHGIGSMEQNNTEDWDAMIDGNVKGLLYVSKAIMAGMVERQRGHIINISSIAGKSVYPGGVVYCASKHAVEALSQGMRLDLTRYGIKVTNIAPGFVETGFSLVRFKGDTARAAAVYEGFEALQPKDIADAVVYAVTAPSHVTIADLTIFASAQSAGSIVHRKTQSN